MPTSVFLNLSQGGEQFTGQLIGPAADNSAAPPFTFSGDLDSGLASAAAGETDLMADGTKALAVTSAAATFIVPVTVSGGTVTASAPPEIITQTWNNAAIAFDGLKIAITDTASSVNSRPFVILGGSGGSGSLFQIFNDGRFISNAGAQLNGQVVNVLANGRFTVQSGGAFNFSAGALIQSTANPNIQLVNSGGSSGWCLDGQVDGVLAVQTRAGADSATVRASQFQNANSTNGQSFNAFLTLTELTTIAATPTTDTTIQMPANSVVLAVSVRVTVAIPTATTFTVGDSGSAARFSTAAVSVNINSTDPGNKAAAYYNASALSIRITPNGTPANNAGRVRVTIYYMTSTPPNS